MYKIVLKKNGDFATVTKNGKRIDCLAGLFVTTGDLAELDKLVMLANRGAAEQSVQSDVCQSSPDGTHAFGEDVDGKTCVMCGTRR